MPNIYDPEWDQDRDHPGFEVNRARIGAQLGLEKIGASVWELPPGKAAYPYHFHYGDEELLVVLNGSPSLRTPEGWRDLERGEVVAFPIGETGAHQLLNRTDQAVQLLMVSSREDLDIVRYPDEGRVGAVYKRWAPDGFMTLLPEDGEVGYWDDVEPPA
jgi:uncharacterized cupin superfamily protein